jgi:tetratricopeptide (TPR) repeat protein
MMKNKRVLASTMAIALAGAALFTGLAEAGSGAADLFQQSYDKEAVGKVEESLASLDSLPAPQRDGYVATLRRAWLLTRLGRNADAMGAYRRAAALEPRSVEARVGLLVPLMALRRWDDAEQTAREVLRLDPGSYLATLRLAFTCYNLGRYPEAAGLYRKLLEGYPSDVEVRSGLGWSLLKMGKAVDAAGEFRAVIEIAPRNALARDGLKASGLN